MTIAKQPWRCKIEIDEQVIQQQSEFKYLGINISFGSIENEVRQQADKIAGCFNDTI
jgi:hypothetical protein